jgi:ribosomal protein L11 methyltransferase
VATSRRVVQVDVPTAEADLAADALWQGGPSAVSELDLGDGRTRLTADVGDSSALARLPATWVVRDLDPAADDSLDAWRAWARPTRAGRRIVLQPLWLAPETTSDDDIVLLLDPGHAFGSGSHPSTRLVVAALEDALEGGERVLDVGTGSGVLAVAACLLGAATIVAIDVDPAAVDATTANAAANGVTDRISVSTDSLATVEGTFDVVVANIGLGVLTELADDLASRTRPGGLVVLSGLLDDQAAQVVARFAELVEVARRTEDGWAAPVLRAPG